jgi:hypothetical protein
MNFWNLAHRQAFAPKSSIPEEDLCEVRCVREKDGVSGAVWTIAHATDCAGDRQYTGGAVLCRAERTREVEESKKRGKTPFAIQISLNGVSRKSGRM